MGRAERDSVKAVFNARQKVKAEGREAAVPKVNAVGHLQDYLADVRNSAKNGVVGCKTGDADAALAGTAHAHTRLHKRLCLSRVDGAAFLHRMGEAGRRGGVDQHAMPTKSVEAAAASRWCHAGQGEGEPFGRGGYRWRRQDPWLAPSHRGGTVLPYFYCRHAWRRRRASITS